MRKTFVLIVSLLSLVLHAQRVDTMTGIFDENLRTLQVGLDGNNMADAIAVPSLKPSRNSLSTSPEGCQFALQCTSE